MLWKRVQLGEKEIKKATFRKVEEGMILESEDGKTYAFGFPQIIEKMTAGEGKGEVSIIGIGGKVKGQQYTKVEYNWHIISGSPLPQEQMNKIKEKITTTSGTVVASLSNASMIDFMSKCRKCGTPLFMIGEEYKCQKCGEPTV
jgi:hypothetical protein